MISLTEMIAPNLPHSLLSRIDQVCGRLVKRLSSFEAERGSLLIFFHFYFSLLHICSGFSSSRLASASFSSASCGSSSALSSWRFRLQECPTKGMVSTYLRIYLPTLILVYRVSTHRAYRHCASRRNRTSSQGRVSTAGTGTSQGLSTAVGRSTTASLLRCWPTADFAVCVTHFQFIVETCRVGSWYVVIAGQNLVLCCARLRSSLTSP